MAINWSEYLEGVYYVTGMDVHEIEGHAVVAFQSEQHGAFLVMAEGRAEEFISLDISQAYKVKFQLLPVTVEEENDFEENILSFEEYVKRKQNNA